MELLGPAVVVVDGAEFQPDGEAVLRLVSRSRCRPTVEFVALTQELSVTLITTHREILRDFGETAVPLARFSAA